MLSSNHSSLDAQSFLESEYASCKYASLVQLLSGSGVWTSKTLFSLGSIIKRKFSPYDWEPSVPFQPCFSIASVLPYLGSQYDPFHDSIEQPKAADGVFGAAEQKILSRMKGNQASGCETKHSMSSHNKISEQVVDKDYCTHGKDSYAAPTETAEDYIIGSENLNSMLEENSQPTRENSDVVRNKTGLHRSDQPILRKDPKEEPVTNKVEKNLHANRNAEEHNASKLMRH